MTPHLLFSILYQASYFKDGCILKHQTLEDMALLFLSVSPGAVPGTTDFQIGKINKHGLSPGTRGGLVLTTTVLLVMPKSLSGTLKVEMYD